MQKHNPGAPDVVRDLLEDLISELRGSYEAEGWAVPEAEIRFIVGRLRFYADKLKDLDLSAACLRQAGQAELAERRQGQEGSHGCQGSDG